MSTDSSTEWPRASPAEVFAHHDARAQKKRVEQLMSLFQQLASVMNETTQHASLAELENQKVQSFTVLSNSLSQISQPATAAVAPGLMSAISSHKHAQERVDAGFAKVGSIWNDIISSAAAGLAVELDVQVDQALERLRRDAKAMVDEMVREAFKKEDEEDVKPVISSYEQVDGKVAGKRKSIVLEHDEDSRKRARMGSASTPSPAPAPAAPPSQGPAGTDEMLKLMHAMMAQLQRNTASTASTAPPPSASSSSAPVYASHRTASPTPHQSAPYGRTTPRRRSPPPPTGPHGYGKPSYERPARQLSGGYDYNTSPPRDAYPQHGSYGGHRPPPPAYPPYEGHAYYERNGR